MDGSRTAALLGVVLLVTACGQPAREPGPTGCAGGVPSCAPSTAPPSTAPTTPAPSRPVTVLRGTVQAGVEAGCLVLATDRGRFLLLGGDPTVLREGAEVVVEGATRPGQATTCQEGTPFSVSAARAEPATTR
ncbi:hypothetical protein FHX81_1563 [Saccharothrix saharensis]|uniref:Lipoprotein n=1 Tax=Saccharothrix saharensis TaxID=571190 RepID=A0A543J8U8_9PSEU|nr:hypothetical protein [Saccharothrix saharensis]TQM79260.1 hypothetical protein FHX81_1563 [Saccharothrix saharensis]